ncbi:O-antigen ligase family protein [Candidatus Daviesbacteria bacterium]|nr:O-antigen ligase family protein [Candidatus Daviesbacteria bacterium]
MTLSLISILAFATAAGQLIRIPIGTHGVTALDITVALFCMVGFLKQRFHLQKPPPQIIAAFIFIFIAVISLLLTPLRLTLSEYLLSFSYTVRLFLYVFFAWLIFSDAFGDLRKNLGKVFLLSGISFATLGLLQFIFFPDLNFLTIAGWDPHYFRTVSTFLDPNFAGAFLVLTLTLILLIQSHLGGGPGRTPRVFCIFFTITYFALLTTFSRSSYLMFLISGMTLSFLKKSRLYFLSTIILFVILLLGFQIYSQLVTTPRNIDRAQSASSRVNTWQQGLILFKSNPILGVGFNSYRYALKKYQLGDEQFLQSHGSSSNDSSLLFVASTTGILGLVAYLYFLWTIFKSSDGKNLYLITGLAGLLIHSLFANSLFYPPILAWILLISISPKK